MKNTKKQDTTPAVPASVISLFQDGVERLSKLARTTERGKTAADKTVAQEVSRQWVYVLPEYSGTSEEFEKLLRDSVRAKDKGSYGSISVRLTHIFKIVRNPNGAQWVEQWAEGEGYGQAEGEMTLQRLYKELNPKQETPAAPPTIEQIVAAVKAGALDGSEVVKAVKVAIAEMLQDIKGGEREQERKAA